MTVRELIELLQKEDPGRLVVLSGGAMGGPSPLNGSWAGAYRAETTWGGEVGYEALTDELRTRGYGDDDVISDGVPALILTPIH